MNLSNTGYYRSSEPEHTEPSSPIKIALSNQDCAVAKLGSIIDELEQRLRTVISSRTGSSKESPSAVPVSGSEVLISVKDNTTKIESSIDRISTILSNLDI